MSELTEENIDKIILTTAMNMASDGVKRAEIIKFLEKMGWSQTRSEEAIEDIYELVKPNNATRKVISILLIPAFITLAILIFYIGDSFLLLPEDGLARLAVSLGYALGFPIIFFLIWTFFVLIVAL